MLIRAWCGNRFISLIMNSYLKKLLIRRRSWLLRLSVRLVRMNGRSWQMLSPAWIWIRFRRTCLLMTVLLTCVSRRRTMTLVKVLISGRWNLLISSARRRPVVLVRVGMKVVCRKRLARKLVRFVSGPARLRLRCRSVRGRLRRRMVR